MNVNDVRLLVQAMEERKDASSPLLPGTVADSLGEGILLVSMDGDPENTEIEVVSFVPGISEGDRVMVLFDPPRGAYAVGIINRAVEAGQVLVSSFGAIEAEPFGASTTTKVLSVATASASFKANRYYNVRLETGFQIFQDFAFSNPIEITSVATVLDSPPVLNAPNTAFAETWVTANGSSFGGDRGTIYISRMMLLAESFTSTGISVEVDVTAANAGTITLGYELSVLDAGPASVVIS